MEAAPSRARRIALAWKAAWGGWRYRVELVFTLAVLVWVISLFTRFLAWVELRPGVVLDDPILRRFDPVDVTVLTFVLIYGALLVALYALLPHPRRMARAMQAYVVMITLRAAAMYMLPLEPPARMITLLDPIVGFFGQVDAPTKDLFFSGHTSTMFLLALVVPNPRFRAVALLATVGVAACVLAQHVHYSVDVLVAPFMAWGAWTMVGGPRTPRGG